MCDLQRSSQPTVLRLASSARAEPLAVYAGAGVSQAPPSCLPGGADIARMCHVKLSEDLEQGALDGADPSSLTSVADAAAEIDGGLDLMKRIVVAASDYTTAVPNYSHKVLALLLLEGYIDVITSNWDTCIERSLNSVEDLPVVKSHEESQEIQGNALMKVHGCVTRPDTIRITTEELDATRPWARYAVNTRIASRRIVFVGVSDVAPYVRACTQEIIQNEDEGSLDNIFLVNPDPRTSCSGSQWSCLLPEMPQEQHLGITADEFFDELAALCVISSLGQICNALNTTRAGRAFAKAQSSILALTSLEALRWFRDCAVPLPLEVLKKGEIPFRDAFVALGFEAADGSMEFCAGGRVLVADIEYIILAVVKTVKPEVLAREAQVRLGYIRADNGTTPHARKFLVAGVDKRIAPPEDLQQDIITDLADEDVMVGPLAGTPEFVYVSEITE